LSFLQYFNTVDWVMGPFTMLRLIFVYAYFVFITFHVMRSRGEMYSGHGCLYVCLSLTTFPHYYMDRI